jgi:hypothetical protein
MEKPPEESADGGSAATKPPSTVYAFGRLGIQKISNHIKYAVTAAGKHQPHTPEGRAGVEGDFTPAQRLRYSCRVLHHLALCSVGVLSF